MDGLTVKELRRLLTQQFSAYVRDRGVHPTGDISAGSHL